MSTYDLPESFRYQSPERGNIDVEFKGDALVITIIDDLTGGESWIELGDAQIWPLMEGFTAVLLELEERVAVDLENRDGDPESIVIATAGEGVSLAIVLWGDASRDADVGDHATFSVVLDAFGARGVYVRLNAIVLRRGLAFR